MAALAILALLASLQGPVPVLRPAPLIRPARPVVAPEAGFHRGVCWVGGDEETELRRLRELGVDWISVTPFGYGHPGRGLVPESYRASRHRGESLDDVRRVTRRARALGLKVMIKPHLWVFHRDGFWRGEITYQRDEDWQAWFHAYGTFLEPFVRMAAEEGAEAFCVGTELAGTVGQVERWTGMIRRIRAIYPGRLTYAANWYKEFEEVGFWGELDWVGVQGYFPLVDFDDRNPSHAELVAGWRPWLDKLDALSKRVGRKVLFTEIGYKPVTGTTHKPWEWRSGSPFDADAQAEAWGGFFDAIRGRDSISGSYVWKWFAHVGGRGWRNSKEFTPQGLPAERVIAERYKALGGR
ncbi:MAG: hypothetical protein R3F30_04155 [Planctomycetota bacterium]